ncbi:helix-turn-helix transcriptional regulator [Geminocystis sp. NIES-3709]|uniref:helix-turn-helix transcriptional regulator n=1 Tax=Geminocystis sp. NIES-3709 TaxID=1617448 RepID=UPI0005FC57B5|nr:AraC family transcriptional regulator [Geminocystis sp. NIES-3709]BAQ65363.1 transcriptional regulator [Geminocystis sp. NIES-3709]
MDNSVIFDPNTIILLPNRRRKSERIVDWSELTFETNNEETIIHFSPRLGKGYNRQISLRGGLTIEIIHVQLRETMYLERKHENIFPLTAHFYLSGMSTVETLNTSEIKPNYTESRGQNYLYHLPDLAEVEKWSCSTEIKVISIYAPLDYFHGFCLEKKTPSNPVLELINKNRTSLFHDQSSRFHLPLGKNTPEMEKALHQIYQCPYHGLMKQLYLESKALELFALQFNCCNSCPFIPQKSSLKKDDLDRVEYAKDILIKSSLNPPSLNELARKVGLNDRKLKQGFKELFSTTVFGYLYNCRMQQAQELLRDSNLTIAQIATRVGYSNPEAFSTAFKRKFAQSPKNYQLKKELLI